MSELALECHPDKNRAPQAEEAFKKVAAAYACLADPEKKLRYDQTGGDPSQMFSTNGPQARNEHGGQ